MTYQWTQGILAANGYGGIGVTVLNLNYGVKIISSEGQSRNSKALYTRAKTSGSFSITICFNSYENFNRTMTWMKTYGSKLSTPDTTAGPMRCLVPVRGFDKTGIPVDGVTFGDRVGNIRWPVTLNFIGVSDPATAYSQFQLQEAQANSANAPYFYPGGSQLAGSQKAADDVIFSYDQSYKDTADPAKAFQTIYGNLGGQ